MGHRFSELTFTPGVVAMQQRFGSYDKACRVRERMPDFCVITAREAEFIQARDSFYMATVTESDWPYIQHRGGDKGFLRVLDEQTLAFANLPGNGQYQSLGNLQANDRVSLFLMDYLNRRRLKILGRAELLALEQVPQQTLQQLPVPQGKAAESVIIIRIDAYDWNCSQHITPRYSTSELRGRED